MIGVAEGYRALRRGEWEAARRAFEADLEDPESLDGYGRALWWLGDAEGALEARERAHRAFAERGDRSRAARIALWLAREHLAVRRNALASEAWAGRAEALIDQREPTLDLGWLELARSERAADPAAAERHASAGLELGRRFGDRDLEVYATARLGLAQVLGGRIHEGMGRLDDAMAAAMGGEVSEVELVGETTCALVLACDVAGDTARLGRWNAAMEALVAERPLPTIESYCEACCAELFLSSGQLAEAEALLQRSIDRLIGGGQQARCAQPTALLAEMRMLQGRLEEAERLLVGYEDAPESVRARASLRLGRREPEVAGDLLDLEIRRLGGANLLTAPLLELLVEARIGTGELEEAGMAAKQLGKLAERTGSPRLAAAAALAASRWAAAGGEVPIEGLERAVRLFSDAGMPLQAARARLELARAMAGDRPKVAAEEARAAEARFGELGARRDADAAAAFLRRLGERGRTGPKRVGQLSDREVEVLRLLGEGLSNAEIAQRLFISPKTAGNHVSNILMKLGAKNRTEAAAHAHRDLG